MAQLLILRNLISIPLITFTTLFPAQTTVEEPIIVEEVIEAPVLVGCDLYRAEVEKYDWDPDTMMRIMKAESGCNPEALNDNPATGDYSVGLLQINLYGGNAAHRPPEEELLIPKNNIAFAYELFKNGGYHHWTTY